MSAPESPPPPTPAEEARAHGFDGTRSLRCDCGEFREAGDKWVCDLCGERWFSIGYLLRAIEAKGKRRQQQRATGRTEILRGL